MLLLYHSDYTLEAGVDKVGRPCLAKPVVATAVILPPDYQHPLLNDSKKFTRELRDQLREDVLCDAVAWAIAETCTCSCRN